MSLMKICNYIYNFKWKIVNNHVSVKDTMSLLRMCLAMSMKRINNHW